MKSVLHAALLQTEFLIIFYGLVEAVVVMAMVLVAIWTSPQILQSGSTNKQVIKVMLENTKVYDIITSNNDPNLAI